jgi:Ca-activated chloride channel homolog
MFFGDLWLAWIVGPLVAVWTALWLLGRYTRTRRAARAAPALAFSNVALLAALPRSPIPTLRRAVEAFRIIVVVLLALALLRPQTTKALTPIFSEGIDIVLAIDTSGSMRALDLDVGLPVAQRRTRLKVVQDVVADFVKKRPADQIGMVVFGAEAFLQCPLTLDHVMVGQLLSELSIGMAGDATAIGTGLATAVNRLKRSKAKSKVVVLLTDGVSNAGVIAPEKAAEIAQSFGVKVYTVGAGSRGKAPIIVSHPLFGDRLVEQEVQIDEDTLKAIAITTGGAYFRAADAKGLEQVYAQIDALERSEIETNVHADYDERFAQFVLPGLLALLAEIVLLGTRLRRLP